PPTRDGDRDPRERIGVRTASFMQLIDEVQENVQFPYSSKTGGYFSKTAIQLARDVRVQREDRNQLAQAPRFDSRAMQGVDVTFGHPAYRPCKPVDVRLQDLGQRDCGHVDGMVETAIIVDICG